MWVGAEYILNMLKDLELMNAKASTISGASIKEEFKTPDVTGEINTLHGISYRCIVGRLQWLTGLEPGILYAVKELARGSSDVSPASGQTYLQVP